MATRTFADDWAYRERAVQTARLIDLENQCAASAAFAAARKADAERAEREAQEVLAWARAALARARAATPRATVAPVATRKAEAELPVIHLPRRGPGGVERRMSSWYMPGGGEADKW